MKKRKDGRYATTVTLGYDSCGRRMQTTVYGRTKAELEKAKAQVLLDVDRGIFVKDKSVTFGAYASKWYDAKCLSISGRTADKYRTILNKFTKIEKFPLASITRADVQDLITDNAQFPEQCRQIKLTLNQIFESAIEDELIYKNPVRKISLPKKQTTEKRILSPSEKILLRDTEFTEQQKVYLLLLSNYGLRRGEALALTKNSFNWSQETISIDHSIAFRKNKPVYKETKTASSKRLQFLLKDDIPVIREYIESLSDDNPFLFRNKNKITPITQIGFRHMFSDIIRRMTAKAEELGIDPPEGLTSHVFRHNYTTMLYYAGVGIKEAQALLGHADSRTTMDIYTHLAQSQEASRNKIQEYLEMSAGK